MSCRVVLQNFHSFFFFFLHSDPPQAIALVNLKLSVPLQPPSVTIQPLGVDGRQAFLLSTTSLVSCNT